MPSLKTKAVHKVLQEDTYCKATEASWSKHSNEVQSLDVLQRCRRLNQFLAQVPTTSQASVLDAVACLHVLTSLKHCAGFAERDTN